jgi:Holliday junction resolvase RusA-like endonuclease
MLQTKVNITPLSVNKVWQGKRFKTPAYKQYERDVLLMLPKAEIHTPPFMVELEFGFSNSLSDIDNPLKPILDIIQKKYGINDKDINELRVIKKIVKKTQEYIKINITNQNPILF